MSCSAEGEEGPGTRSRWAAESWLNVPDSGMSSVS